MYRNILTLFAIAGSASAATLSIHVGENGGLMFNPNSMTAAVGDTLEFHFYSGSGGHSVVSSSFSTPCSPSTNAFFSGYIPGNESGDTTFVTTVQSTDPIWFYCSLGDHCQSGMVGVVNPPAGQSISDYMTAAQSATKGAAPAELQGGVLTTITASASASGSSAAESSSSMASSMSSSTESSMATSASSTMSESQTVMTEASTASTSQTSSEAESTSTAASTSSKVAATSTSASAGVSPATSTTSAGTGVKGEMGTIMGLAIVAGGLVAMMA